MRKRYLGKSKVKKIKVQGYEIGDIEAKQSQTKKNKTEKSDCFEDYNLMLQITYIFYLKVINLWISFWIISPLLLRKVIR